MWVLPQSTANTNTIATEGQIQLKQAARRKNCVDKDRCPDLDCGRVFS
jgi:hypothetical protein